MASAVVHEERILKEVRLTGILRSVRFGKEKSVSAERGSPAQPANLEAYNRLVTEYQDAAYNFAYYILGDPDLAEDVTQKAFINAYRQFHTFKGETFRGWIMTIVRNACYDELRKLKNHHPLSLETLQTEDSDWNEWLDVTQDEPSLEQALERKERDWAIRAALNGLNENFRSAVILVDLQGMDYQEAAQVMKIPVGTLKSRLARARKQLTQLPEILNI